MTFLIVSSQKLKTRIKLNFFFVATCDIVKRHKMSLYTGRSSKEPLFRVKCNELFVVTFLILAATQFSEAVLLNAKSQPTSEILVSEQDLEALSHVRAKRAVPANSKKSEISPMATNVHLNNSHLHLMVHWAGQGSPVLFCLGRDQVILSILFRKIFHGI